MRPCFVSGLMWVVFFFATASAFEPQFETGFIEWSQPNGVTFIAKAWGDNHVVWYETEGGYRFVTRGDGWHCYATLDKCGEFAPSEFLVAIDKPPESAHHLERTQERMNQIEEWLAAPDPHLDTLFQHYRQLQAQRNAEGRPLVIRVNVLLVEFLDIHHYIDTRPEPTRPLGYLKTDFDSLLFSHNSWIDFTGSIHPEGDSVFGSLSDFYEQMSLGKLQVEGHVVNPPDENGIPTWITLADSQSFYGVWGGAENFDLLFDSTFARAVGYNWLTAADSSNDTLKYIVLYAGNVIPTIQWTATSYWSGHLKMSERKGWQISTIPPVKFTHIGWPTHEFGHLMGFNDEYESGASIPHINNSTTVDFELMAMGEHNGPGRRGACPASLSPFYRIGMHWVPSIPIERDTTDVEIAYDYQSPRFYRIDPQAATNDEHYLIETRNREGFDFYLPNHPDNFATQPGTLLIWHHNGRDADGNLDRICLMFADDVVGSNTYAADFFPKDDVLNQQDFNDRSVPPAILGFHFPPHPDLRVEYPANFALNGIHRSGNNTVIDTIALRYKFVSTPVANSWHMLSVPVTLTNYVDTVVFRRATSHVFAYSPDSGYVRRTTLKNGPGYWVRFGGNDSVVLGGEIRETDTAMVTANWNMVGSISDTMDTANVCLLPSSNHRLTPFYRFNNGYVPDSSIVPGLGYWVKVSMDGQMVFKKNASPCGSGLGFGISEMDHFTITDAQGRKQDVYVANLGREPSLAQVDLSMPPPLPEAEFDARFESVSGGDFVKTVSPDSGVVELVISVETQSYPVTVTWELNPENGIEYSITTEGMGKPSGQHSIARSGSTTMVRPSGGKLRFAAEVTGRGAKEVLPTVFALAQNYPNPFNPSTRIHYELPCDAQVHLAVYDLLGRQVATLVDDLEKAGRYDVTFKATHLASGVYFYRLQAGTFNQARKLLLLR